MTRLAMIPENQFAEDFKELRRDIKAIKNAQRVGRDIMRPRVVQFLDGGGNPTAYDFVTALNIYGDGTRFDFTITFTADNQIEPWATPFYQVYYGNPNTPAAAEQVSGFNYISFSRTGERKIAYKGYVQNAVYLDVTLLYVKVYFYASDTGTLTLEEGYLD